MQRRDGGGGPGSLTVVGIGPGDQSLLAPMALAALKRATVIVGYGTYVDLLDPALLETREVLVTGMKKEMDRVQAAVDRARGGDYVAIVSSGDAGVYGMAGLALELLGDDPGVDFCVVPGIPALAAGAALLGAPLTHDFAVISLSDLLTPWEVIEKRIEHAAASDFVLVLYNPRSKRRDWQLPRAMELVAPHREASTPVGLVHSAYREGQQVSACTLADFDPAEADMLSIIFVGNASTRLQGSHMVTPRGYLDKYGMK